MLVVIGSMPLPTCNCFHERLANNGKVTTITGSRSLMPSCAGYLEPRKSRLGPSKSTFNAKNFICRLSLSCPSLFISAQFALQMCLIAQNRQKSINNFYSGVLSHPRSLLLVLIESPDTSIYKQGQPAYKIVFGLVNVQCDEFFAFSILSTRGYPYKFVKASCSTSCRSQFFNQLMFGIVYLIQ